MNSLYSKKSALFPLLTAAIMSACVGCSGVANAMLANAQRNNLHGELAFGEQSPAAFSEDMRQLDRACLQRPL